MYFERRPHDLALVLKIRGVVGNVREHPSTVAEYSRSALTRAQVRVRDQATSKGVVTTETRDSQS